MIIYTAIYRLAIAAYFAAIRIAALFSRKAWLFVTGRRGLIRKIRLAFEGDTRPRIWMHCASLGEFEQGRPVLESLHERHPEYAIVVTFFSASGYEVRRDYKGADHVFYLPMDSNDNAKEFLYIVQPRLCIFVKYEFWYFYLTQIAAGKIPVILLSAIFSKDQEFFKWYGGLQRKMLSCFSHIFVQDEASKLLLGTIHINQVSISGDTRFDRVIMAAQQTDELPVAQSFADGHKVIVAGSTWREDELFLHKVIALLPDKWKLMLVPHEVDNAHLDEIEKLFDGNIIKWSNCVATGIPVKDSGKKVLLVDKVGFLIQLYRYGNVAWIGGGFGKDGVHNVLEAAVYGIPCFYGPVFHQFIEAKELIEKGGAFTTGQPADFVALLQKLQDENEYARHAGAARAYVYSGGGATKQVMEFLETSKFIS
jgi:3-deoxy-D-manno-octulosonic-acid transferase